MNIRQLQYFLELYQNRSVKNTAQKLFVSSQAVSKTLASLEKELNTSLFRRTKQGLEPTREAMRLKIHAQKIMEEMNIIQNPRPIEDIQKVLVTIYSVDNVFSYLGVEFLQAFHSRYPNILLHIVESTESLVLEKLQSGESEFVIMTSFFDNEAFSGYFLFENQYCAVVHKSNPLSKKNAILPEDLDQQPLVGKGREFACYRKNMGRILQNGVQPNIILETNNDFLICNMAEQNLAIGICLDCSAYSNPTPNTVVLPFQDIGINRTVYLLEKTERQLSKEANLVKKFIIQWTRETLIETQSKEGRSGSLH